MLLPAGAAHRTGAQLDQPGARFRYDNAAVHLLGCALADAVGCSLAECADEHLWPARDRRLAWPSDPEGYSWGFGHRACAP